MKLHLVFTLFCASVCAGMAQSLNDVIVKTMEKSPDEQYICELIGLFTLQVDHVMNEGQDSLYTIKDMQEKFRTFLKISQKYKLIKAHHALDQLASNITFLGDVFWELSEGE